MAYTKLIIAVVLLIVIIMIQHQCSKTGEVSGFGSPLGFYYNYVPDPRGNNVYKAPGEHVPVPTELPGANTLKQPGNVYDIEIHKKENIPPSLIVELQYTCTTHKHPLVWMFYNAIKEFQQNPAMQTVEFVSKLVDDQQCGGSTKFPYIIKYKPAQPQYAVEFRGFTAYGVLQDWILNEGFF